MIRKRTILVSAMMLVACGAGLVKTAGLAAGDDSYLSRGIALYNAKRYGEAARALDTYGLSNPHNVTALYYDALSYHRLGNMQRAHDLYEKILDINPTSDAGRMAAQALSSMSATTLAPSVADTLQSSLNGNSAAAVSGLSADDRIPDEAKVFYTNEHGQMQVDAIINGRRTAMIFDTGAPGVYISKSQLAYLGIPLAQDAKETVVGGATAQVAKAWTTTADISVGDVVRKHVPIIVAENAQTMPLLGQDFFREMQYSIDRGNRSITFYKSGSRRANQYSADTYAVPYEWREMGNRILVSPEVNGKKMQMIFDTGNTGAAVVFFNPMQLMEVGIAYPPPDARMGISMGYTGQGRTMGFNVDRIKLGPIEKSRVECNLNFGGGMDAPLLGQKFLEGWQYSIDREKKVINLKRLN